MKARPLFFDDMESITDKLRLPANNKDIKINHKYRLVWLLRFFVMMAILGSLNSIAFAATVDVVAPTATLYAGANSNSYSLSGQVTFTSPPATGTLVVSVKGGHSKVFTAPFVSPINYVIQPLVADGASSTVTATFSADPASADSINFTAPNPVGTGFNTFPMGSTVSNFLWGTSPYPQQSWDKGYLPGYGGPYDFGGGIHDLDLTPPGVTNIAAVCGELAEGVAGGSGSNYVNKYQYMPLEYNARGTAGNPGDESANIPVGGIGKVRAGMIRYLFDQYYTSVDANSWTAVNGAAFQLAVWEVVHESYASNNSFSVNSASANGFYFLATYNLTSVNLAQTYVTAINTLNWSNEQWMAYQPTDWHVLCLENNGDTIGNNSQDLIFAQPIVGNEPVAACEITDLVVTPGACNNNGTPNDATDDYYTANVGVTFANKPSSGNLVLSGAALHATNSVSTVAVGSTTSATTHTFVGVRLKANGVANALTSTFSADPVCTMTINPAAVANCSTPPACAITSINVTPGACNNNGTPNDSTDDYYTASVTVNYTNPPASGNLVLSGPALHSSNSVTTVAVGSLNSATSHTFTGVRLVAQNASPMLTASFN